jgi:membrane dipeptidase
MRHWLRGIQAAAVAASLATAGLAAQGDAVTAKARAIHDRVMTLDTHVDINAANFTAACNYTQDLGNQVNLPKMVKGGLDAAFFIVYVGQGELTPEGYANAYRQASEKFDAIHRLTREIAPDRIGLALTSDDARRIYQSGRKVAFIGVENGYPIGEDLGRIKEFHDRGARYLSLAHNGHSQLSDSNTGEAQGWKWNGLSPLGRQAIAELNRVGIMIDISHPSKASMMQTLALTKAPIIASHSSVRKLANHSRNLDDEQLLALKENGGVMQTVAFNGYVKIATDSPERAAALAALRKEFGLPENTPLGGGRGAGGARGAQAAGGTGNPCAQGARGAAAAGARGAAGAPGAGGGGGRGGGRGGALNALTDEQRADLQRKLAEINTKFPPSPRATVKDFVDHIDYAVKLIGIDHVGISSDFDGGGGVDGWNGADETFNVTLELVNRGYTEEQIGKLWSGNLLRVLDRVQAVAKTLQK